ncbi:hypothetical protein SESBI_25910 [Sesbania bispinosa]|nr:hypothetical protein SESBI_25910 [Sesbania bispinosa]
MQLVPNCGGYGFPIHRLLYNRLPHSASRNGRPGLSLIKKTHSCRDVARRCAAANGCSERRRCAGAMRGATAAAHDGDVCWRFCEDEGVQGLRGGGYGLDCGKCCSERRGLETAVETRRCVWGPTPAVLGRCDGAIAAWLREKRHVAVPIHPDDFDPLLKLKWR